VFCIVIFISCLSGLNVGNDDDIQAVFFHLTSVLRMGNMVRSSGAVVASYCGKEGKMMLSN
jgi:hypothetical protein